MRHNCGMPSEDGGVKQDTTALESGVLMRRRRTRLLCARVSAAAAVRAW
jgi:hypothetical protein